MEYEVLTPMLDAEETLKNPPPPLVADEEYPGREMFDRKPFVIQRGDLEKGFEEADVIVEETYTTQVSHHGTIQTRACIASWDGHDLTVWDAIQGVWNSKLALAKSSGSQPGQRQGHRQIPWGRIRLKGLVAEDYVLCGKAFHDNGKTRKNGAHARGGVCKPFPPV